MFFRPGVGVSMIDDTTQEIQAESLQWFSAGEVFAEVDGPLCHLLGASARSDAQVGPPGPQAFRVTRTPDDGPLGVHFHPVDQFQVFIRGTGRFSRHPVRFGSVHYSDSMTPYGPIVGDTPGITWLTLRANNDRGAHFMPDSRDELRLRASNSASHRNVRFELARESAPRGGWRNLVSDTDGLGVWIGRGDVHAPLDEAQVGGLGAFAFVVSGCLEGPDGPLRAGSFAWAPPGCYGAIPVRHETVIALLQFPNPS
jgi:hypothetical protein